MNNSQEQEQINYERVDFFKLWGFKDVVRATKEATQGDIFTKKAIYRDFINCNLQESKFDKMNLEGFNLSGSDLRGASFKDATLLNTRIDNAITGVSLRHFDKFKVIAYVISFVSGLIASYSVGFFIFILLKSYISYRLGLGIEEAIVLPYLFAFIISVVFSLKEGIRSFFPLSLLVTTFVSFLHQSIDPNGARASVSTLALSCFVGAFAGMLANSQATYLVKEIVFLVRKPSTTEDQLLKRTNQLAILGSFLGAITGGNFENLVNSSIAISSALLSVLVIYAGRRLGVKAHDEKDELRRESGDIPFNYSIEEDLTSDWTRKHGEKATKYILINKLIAVISKVEEEIRKSQKTRYLAIRIFFDSILNSLKTDFSGSKLVDVTFAGTNLSGSIFSPAFISLSPKKGIRSGSVESYEVDIEDFKVVREAKLNPGSTIIQTFIDVRGSVFEQDTSIGSHIDIFNQPFPKELRESSLSMEEGNMSAENSINVNNATNVTGSTFGSNSTNEIGNVNISEVGSGIKSEALLELIESLIGYSKLFPDEQQKVGAKIELERLKEELKKPPKEQRTDNVNYYLKGLVAILTSVLLGVGGASEQIKAISTNAVDIVENTKAISEEVQRIKDNSPEFKALSHSDREAIETVGVFSDGLSQIAKEYKLQAE